VSTFGQTSQGASTAANTAGYKYAGRFQLTESGSCSKISWLFGTTGSPYVGGVTACLYSDSGGTPDALLASKERNDISTGSPTWYDFTWDTPVSLTAGYYWLAVHFESTGLTYYYTAASGTNYYKTDDSYADGPADPFGSGTAGTTLYSVYATYDASTTGTGAAQTATVSFSGTGTITHTGTGALEIGAVQISGTGGDDSGMGWFSLPSVRLMGLVNPGGSGAVKTGAVSLGGAGTISAFYGTGAPETAPVEVAGTGAVSIAGTGAAETAAVQLGGSGFHGQGGYGAVETAPVAVAGSSTVTYTGTGGPETAAVQILGSGTVGIAGTGAPNTAAVQIQGTGSIQPALTGTGHVTTGTTAISGSGTVTITGTGGPTITFAVSGTGTISYTGSGAVETAAISVAGYVPAFVAVTVLTGTVYLAEAEGSCVLVENEVAPTLVVAEGAAVLKE